MAAKAEAVVSGMFDEALTTFNDAVKTGVKVQEEIGKWWSDALDQAGPADQWQKKSKAIMSEAIPAAQKNAEEWLKLVEQNYKRSLTLLKKAWQADANATNVRAKTQDLWESSLELVRDNTQAIAQANMKMMEVWAGVLKNGVSSNSKK